jgi:hypothetical protein
MTKLVSANVWPPHIVRSILLGALVAAFLMAVYFIVDMTFVPHVRFAGENDLSWGLMVVVVTFLTWGAGITVLGVPAWCALHRYGYRNWSTAAALGFALPFVVSWRGADTMSVIAGFPQKHGWEIRWLDLTWGAVGVVVAFVIWRTAYARTPSA